MPLAEYTRHSPLRPSHSSSPLRSVSRTTLLRIFPYGAVAPGERRRPNGGLLMI